MTIPFAVFEFLIPTMLIAVGAASIPVIIHLLNRRRYQIVTWAAMRFLLNAQKQNTRRMRLEQLILLLLRMALVLLIVLAMASVSSWAETVWTFIWPNGAGFIQMRAGRVHKVIVLDGSLSMATRYDNDHTCFELAKKRAIEIVEKSQPGDAFSVLLMKDHPEWIVGGVSSNSNEVIKAIEIAGQAHGNADVPGALKEVAEKLGETPARFKGRQAYFLTDLQKATWLPGNPNDKEARGIHMLVKGQIQQIQKLAQSVFIDVHKENANNLAVTDLTLGPSLITTGIPVPVAARIEHFGVAVQKNLKVELRVGKARSEPTDPPFKMEPVQAGLIDIKPGGNVSLNLEYKFSKPGTYAVQIRIGGDDLPPDNSRTVIVTVRDTIPVLLVNGQPAAERFDTATEYLRLALNPFTSGAIPRIFPMRPKVVSTSQFSKMRDIQLADYDCIYLANIGQISSGQIRRLETHLQRGGGLVVSMGDESADQLKMYNDFLFKNGKGILPAKLIGEEQSPPKRHYVPHGDKDAFELPPLKAFQSITPMGNVRFTKYVRSKVGDSQAARVILSLMSAAQPDAGALPKGQTMQNGDPLLIEWNPPMPVDKKKMALLRKPGQSRDLPRYRGKVVLMTSSWSMDWTSWPGSPSYAAMIQELTRLAIAGRLREHAAVVGSPLQEHLLSNGTRFNVRLRLPGGATRNLTTQGQGDVTVFRWPLTDHSGVYRMTVGQDVRDYLFAVNVPTTIVNQNTSESELRKSEKAEIKKAYPGWELQFVTDIEKVQHRLPTDDSEDTWVIGKMGPEIARLVMYAVVIALFLEVILACVFGRFSAAPGSIREPTPTGILWPLGAAAVAGGIFVVTAAVLFHASATGDFLGFLPNGIRAGIESFSGIPAPPSGEGRKWEPEFSAFFFDTATDFWIAGFILAAYTVALFIVYCKEGYNVHPGYKCVLGGLRWFMMFLALGVWLPQLQVNIKRESWPDVILMMDDSLSMGETDVYRDSAVGDLAREFGKKIKEDLRIQLPPQIKKLQLQIDGKLKAPAGAVPNDQQKELKLLQKKLADLESQFGLLDSDSWRPNRLQLAQSLIHGKGQNWISQLLSTRQMKVHVYHLDAVGKALKISDAKGKPIAISEAKQPEKILAAENAIANLGPYATESQLGTAMRQVLDHFGGSSVAAVIFLTDGITTSAEDQSGYERNLAKAAEYANLKGVPLFIVGIGDDHELRDLRLHDLQVVDTVYVNDRVIFEARLTGKGFKDLTVPVVLKIRDADGTETEVDRKIVKVDPHGKPVQIQLKDQPKKPGERLYVVEVIPPKKSKQDREQFSNLRLQRTVFVQEAKPIRVLYVEGSARYEYRFLKALLEREKRDAKGDRSIIVKVLLLDADPDFPAQDATAISEFPFNKAELSQYDTVILGDVDIGGRFGDPQMRLLADFVREKGGGLLVISGPLFSPHVFRKTPLADVLPIDPDRVPPNEPAERKKGYQLVLTPAGQLHPIFRLSPNHADNLQIWSRLKPMFWWSSGFKIKPAAEVLAVHPDELGNEKFGPGKEARLPLVVQHFVGAGRCMFFGFEEGWRWRWRDDEIYYNKFWIETVRYLSRNRVSHTRLFLDRQTPYRQGEKIKVTVRFPDNTPLPGEVKRTKAGIKTDVRVMVKHQPDGAGKGPAGLEPDSLQLVKVEGSWATYEGHYPATQKGKYNFWLSAPDVSSMQPNKKPPSAEAVVMLPPGELDRLRMNREEMEKAAAVSGGEFYTLTNASDVLSDLPSGYRVLLNAEARPWVLWNHVLCFLLAIAILTAEWLLRKRKHLL